MTGGLWIVSLCPQDEVLTINHFPHPENLAIQRAEFLNSLLVTALSFGSSDPLLSEPLKVMFRLSLCTTVLTSDVEL